MSRFQVCAAEREVLREALRLFQAAQREERAELAQLGGGGTVQQVLSKAAELARCVERGQGFPMTPLAIGILRQALAIWTAHAVAVLLCELPDSERRVGDQLLGVVQLLAERLAKADLWELDVAGAA